MAESKVTDLPVINESEFTDNDRFLIIDDGKARLITKATLTSWIQNNLQGEQGEQGVAGRDGINGAKGADGLNGQDGLSAYQVFVNTGFTGDINAWKASLKGADGTTANAGTNGWSPLIKTATRGSDVILEVVDWFGGTGSKPTTLGYLSDLGIVASKTNATSIKGVKGDTGTRGADGSTAYQVALNNGYVGSATDWLASLKGVKGDTGATGATNYDIAVAGGFVGTQGEWLLSLKGDKGDTGSLVDENTGLPIKIWTGTQVEYDALSAVDPETLYVVKP